MYGKSTYGANPYGAPTGVSAEEIFSELTITVFGSGKKILHRGNDVDVLVTVFGDYDHGRLAEKIALVSVEAFGSYSSALTDASFSNVGIEAKGKGEVRRFGSGIDQVTVHGVGLAAKKNESGVFTTVFVGAFGKATFEPVIDVDSLFWVWPLSVAYDGEPVYYTRPGDHWTKGRSNRPGSRATFRFLGEQIRTRLSSDGSSGRVRVYLNGVFQDELDLFSVLEDEVFYQLMDLSAGLNEVRLVPTGLANPASDGSDVQIGGFEYKLPVNVEDKGEEIARLAWGAMRAEAG